MIRSAISIIAGIATAFVTVMLVEMIDHQIYPIPTVDPHDLEAVRGLVASLPVGALLIVALGWAVAALGGGAVAALVSGKASLVPSTIVGVLLLLSTVGNMLMIPHPLGMWIAGVLVPIPAAAAGGWLVARKR